MIATARRRTREHARASSRRREQITGHCLDFGFEEYDPCSRYFIAQPFWRAGDGDHMFRQA
ncbi:MAG: hypothetical protein ACREDJ_04625 [Methylocella sp.]